MVWMGAAQVGPILAAFSRGWREHGRPHPYQAVDSTATPPYIDELSQQHPIKMKPSSRRVQRAAPGSSL